MSTDAPGKAPETPYSAADSFQYIVDRIQEVLDTEDGTYDVRPMDNRIVLENREDSYVLTMKIRDYSEINLSDDEAYQIVNLKIRMHPGSDGPEIRIIKADLENGSQVIIDTPEKMDRLMSDVAVMVANDLILCNDKETPSLPVSLQKQASRERVEAFLETLELTRGMALTRQISDKYLSVPDAALSEIIATHKLSIVFEDAQLEGAPEKLFNDFDQYLFGLLSRSEFLPRLATYAEQKTDLEGEWGIDDIKIIPKDPDNYGKGFEVIVTVKDPIKIAQEKAAEVEQTQLEAISLDEWVVDYSDLEEMLPKGTVLMVGGKSHARIDHQLSLDELALLTPRLEAVCGAKLVAPEVTVKSVKHYFDEETQTFAWSSLGGRVHNEDGFAIVPGEERYAVADGMGGPDSGEQASKLALMTWAVEGDLSKANDVLTDKMHPFSDGGTTFAEGRVLERFDDESVKLEVEHQADSVPMLLDTVGKREIYMGLEQNIPGGLRADPKKTHEYFHEKKWGRSVKGPLTHAVIDEVVRLKHSKANTICNGINCSGTYKDKEPISKTQICPKGTVMLLLTDGVTDVMSRHEIAQIFYENPFHEACVMLANEVERRQKDLSGGDVVLQVWPDGTETVLEDYSFGNDNATFVGRQF
jgi:hypothetical protein